MGVVIECVEFKRSSTSIIHYFYNVIVLLITDLKEHRGIIISDKLDIHCNVTDSLAKGKEF
jgi:hypothetical protein